jgi:hypothetical protein
MMYLRLLALLLVTLISGCAKVNDAAVNVAEPTQVVIIEPTSAGNEDESEEAASDLRWEKDPMCLFKPELKEKAMRKKSLVIIFAYNSQVGDGKRSFKVSKEFAKYLNENALLCGVNVDSDLYTQNRERDNDDAALIHYWWRSEVVEKCMTTAIRRHVFKNSGEMGDEKFKKARKKCERLPLLLIYLTAIDAWVPTMFFYDEGRMSEEAMFNLVKKYAKANKELFEIEGDINTHRHFAL